MKLSTRSRYGLRAILALALHGSDEPMMTKEIAEKQNLPGTYLEQLMLTLRKAGLVVAKRGAKGGYVLARDPREIPLTQIVEALEGPLDIARCADAPNCCQDPVACALKDVFADANNAMRSAFDRVSLYELSENQKRKESAITGMFHI